MWQMEKNCSTVHEEYRRASAWSFLFAMQRLCNNQTWLISI